MSAMTNVSMFVGNITLVIFFTHNVAVSTKMKIKLTFIDSKTLTCVGEERRVRIEDKANNTKIKVNSTPNLLKGPSVFHPEHLHKSLNLKPPVIIGSARI